MTYDKFNNPINDKTDFISIPLREVLEEALSRIEISQIESNEINQNFDLCI